MGVCPNFARLGVFVCLTLLAGAQSEEARSANYPERSVEMIAPYNVGGDSDVAARMFAAAAEKVMGKPMVVLNKPGASGTIGSRDAANAKPDGYTLLLGRTGSQAILPAISPTRTPYKWDEFTIIGLLELNPYACMTRAGDYADYAAFAEALRSKGPSLNYGSAGALTTNDMGPRRLFQLLKLEGKKPSEISYKGTGDAVLALLKGDVHFACGAIGPFAPHIKAGKLRALFVSTQRRLESFPDVPTAAEVKLPEMEDIVGWSALYGPPGMSAELVEYWSKALKSVEKDENWTRSTELAGSLPHIRTGAEAKQFVKEQIEMYQKLGKSLDIIDKF